MLLRTLLLSVFLLASHSAFNTSVAQPPEVAQITPSGEDVPSGHQILITFNRDIVPLGRMERDTAKIPINIKPTLECQWRWLTVNSLACQLDNDKAFTPATKYTLTINQGALNEQGERLAQPYTHTFQTTLAKANYAIFDSIEKLGKPVSRVYFDQAVTMRSAKKVLKYRYSVNGKSRTTNATLLNQENVSNQALDKRALPKHAERWRVQPTKPLPKNTAVELIALPGLATPHGNLKSTEEHVVDEFHTYDDFTFLGLSCYDNSYQAVQFSLEEISKAECNPEGEINLDFSSPVNRQHLHELYGLHATGEPPTKVVKISAGNHHDLRIRSYHSKDQRYSVALPGAFKPNLTYSLKALAQEAPRPALTDLFDQTLDNQLIVPFKTLHYTPNFQLPHTEVVLESGVNSDVLIYQRNIETLDFEYQSTDPQDQTSSQQTLTIEPGFTEDRNASIALGVREILGAQSGIVSGHITSTSVPANVGRSQSVTAQITPYQVHAKMGHFSSLVWVTDMASGELVSDAKVEALLTNDLFSGNNIKVLNTTITDTRGIAHLPGLIELDPHNLSSIWCGSFRSCQRLLLRVTKESASAVLPINQTYQVSNGESQGVYLNRQSKFGHLQAWGTTAQGLYRQGDTIRYKLYVRDQDLQGLVAAPKGRYQLEVKDAAGKIIHSLDDIELNDHGSVSGEIKLTDKAAIGWYTFMLTSEHSKQTLYPIEVLISDFTPSPFRLTQKTNGELFTANQELIIDATAALHAGGPFTQATAEFEIYASATPFTSSHPTTQTFNFTDYNHTINTHGYSHQLLDAQVPLDASGQASSSLLLPALDSSLLSASLDIQTSVSDDRGKSVISTTHARYLGVDRLVGLKSNKWVYESGQTAALDYIVVDKLGKPVPNIPVTITIEKRETIALEDNNPDHSALAHYQEIWSTAARCKENSKATAQSCSFTPESAGVYRFTAAISDTENRAHRASHNIWVTGKDDMGWQNQNNQTLEMVPEKSNFEIGEKARFLVKNPHPGAPAIITIERYGVLDSWQQTLDGSAPTIEIDIKPEYAPGVYLSVLLTTPRTSNNTPAPGQLDDGKPNYKLGYQKLMVSDPEKAIKVHIDSDETHYKPGEIVTLTITPTIENAAPSQDIELAVSVLDESVFDLVRGGTEYFNPYKGFNQLTGLDVSNYNLLKHLVGLQTFSDKATDLNQQDSRHESDTNDLAFYADSIMLKAAESIAQPAILEEVAVSATREQDVQSSQAIEPRDMLQDSAHWDDQVTVNNNGSVTIKFKLPDNLTAWRVLALASTPTDRMGLGDYSFKVNQPIEIRPVMPNQVMEDDHFDAGFSVHNRSEKSRTISVLIEPQGDVKEFDSYEQTIELAPHARQTVFMPMSASRLDEATLEGQIEYLVRAYDNDDGDALKHVLPIQKRRNLSSAAVYGSTVGNSIEQAIRFPDNIASELGGLSVQMSPTILSNVDGAFKYMRDYPYACWEQKLTKAVMASHYQQLKPYVSGTLKWPNSAELPQQTLDNAIGHQAPNGGMTYFVAKDEFVSPYLSAYTALAFSWLEDAGYKLPAQVQESLHDYLTDLLLSDSFPSYFSKSMKTTVRAVAVAAIAKHQDLDNGDLVKYLDQDDKMSLFGQAQLLNALSYVDNTEEAQRELLAKILAHSNSSAGKIAFNDMTDPGYARIHSSSMRTNCAILASISQSNKLLIDQELPSKLVQTIIANRKGRNHWENTQDNVFCLNALAQYAKIYEAQKPELTTQVSLDTESLGSAQFRDYKDPRKTIKMPMSADLIGKHKTLTIEHTGLGRVYYQTLLQYSDKNDSPSRENNGINLRRELSVFRDEEWHILGAKDSVKRGELLRTDLFVSVPANRNFVAVRDPVAGGLEPINEDLATSGMPLKIDRLESPAKGSHIHSRANWQRLSFSPWGFYHQELGHDAVTFYSDYLATGEYHLRYFSQAIASGKFAHQAAHAEEMYHPDIYGKSSAGKLWVIE